MVYSVGVTWLCDTQISYRPINNPVSQTRETVVSGHIGLARGIWRLCEPVIRWQLICRHPCSGFVNFF